MYLRRLSNTLSLMGLLSASSLAFAYNITPNVYFGANLGATQSNTKITDTNTTAASMDETYFGYKFFGGYQYNQNFAVEGGFADFGRVQYTSSTAASNGIVKTRALFVEAVGVIPLNSDLSFNVKAGPYRSYVTKDANLVFRAGSTPDSEFGFMYGLGGRYDLNQNLSLRADWDKLTQGSSSSMFSGGLVYTFA